uniref:Secreted protein n=1 Tax=Catagonus wagneri TaxID=51154 RepID=A0A8C3W4Q2_9CETA
MICLLSVLIDEVGLCFICCEFTTFKNMESRAWWRAPVVPATREAEAGGSLEPRSSGLQCAMPGGIAPVNSHCTPAWAT